MVKLNNDILPFNRQPSLLNMFLKLQLTNALLPSSSECSEEIYFYYYCTNQSIRENRFSDGLGHANKAIELWEKESDGKKFCFELGIKKPIKEYIDTLLLRANILVELMKYKEALKDYDLAISYSSDQSQIWFNRGICKVFLEDFFAASYDFSSVIELRPFSPEAFKYRGYCWYKRGLIEKALVDFQKGYEQGDKESESFIIELKSRINDGK